MAEQSYADRIREWRKFLPVEYDEAEMVKKQAQRLIEWLYNPVPNELGWVTSRRVDTEGLAGEAINWGDLGVMDVVTTSEGFLMHVEEADPDCPNFCHWLSEKLAGWGWQVEVITEW
jgi:hypothetical protein